MKSAKLEWVLKNIEKVCVVHVCVCVRMSVSMSLEGCACIDFQRKDCKGRVVCWCSVGCYSYT